MKHYEPARALWTPESIASSNLKKANRTLNQPWFRSDTGPAAICKKIM